MSRQRRLCRRGYQRYGQWRISYYRYFFDLNSRHYDLEIRIFRQDTVGIKPPKFSDLPEGVSPTKVRKVPQDSCQLPGRKGFAAIPELPRRDLV